MPRILAIALLRQLEGALRDRGISCTGDWYPQIEVLQDGDRFWVFRFYLDGLRFRDRCAAIAYVRLVEVENRERIPSGEWSLSHWVQVQAEELAVQLRICEVFLDEGKRID